MSRRRLLVRHFLRQFASFEGTATGGEAKWVIIAILSLVAGPGYLAALVAARDSRRMALTHTGIVPPELWLWKQEWLLLAVSLVAVSVLVAVQWRSFVLGGRDYRILGLLPIRRRTVISAKLQSLVAVVLLLHLAINALPGLWLPVASPFGYFRAGIALQVALLLQTLFGCASIVAVQGIVSLLLSAGVARRASLVVQAAVLLAASLLFVAEGAISRLAFAMRDHPHAVNSLVPVVWFRALYVWLLGVDSAELASDARLALVATAVAVAVAIPCTLVGFRDERAGAKARYGEGAAFARVGSAFSGLAKRPIARGVSFFVMAALVRSTSAGLIARGLFLVGVALTLSGFIGIALRDIGASAPVIPAQPLYAPAFVLPFFALVGLRLAAVYPAALEANWLFRLTEVPGSKDYAVGVRSASLRVVGAILTLLALPYAVFWGVRAAAVHIALALAVALVTIEWLFLRFPKVPFTCTYQPGKANLRITWPKHAAIFFVYCGLLPTLAARVEAWPWPAAAILAALLVLRHGLASLRDREAAGERLRFDEAANPFVTTLDLQWAGPVDRQGRRPASIDAMPAP